MISTEKGTEFELSVCNILYQTAPYSISHYNGGADRGRDILVQYKIDETIYDVIVECKCYTQSVNKENIMASLDWAKVHKPALLYLWVKPYLTPSTKDYISLFCQEYGISVLCEEELNIKKYSEELEKEESPILLKLKDRIKDYLIHSNHSQVLELEYDSQIINTDHFLADREWERTILMGTEYEAYYIQGVSACGKTQLTKNIAYTYKQQGYKIFWHTIRDEESERQAQSFYRSLSHFFEVHYNNDKLQKYLKNHGYYLSNELLSILTILLKKYQPIIIIDDAHKCTYDNAILKDSFEIIIINSLCRIYFTGWFNIFQRTISISKKLKIVILEGLQENDLDNIIIHYTGHSQKNIAALIQNKFNGLPGYAILVDEKTNRDNFESNDTFLHKFLDCLSQDEIKVIFILTFSSVPIHQKYFSKLNLLENVYLLAEKRLVENKGNVYNIHDKYKPFFKNYNLNEQVLLDIISCLKIISIAEVDIILDIAEVYTTYQFFDEAFNVLESSFPRLLHKQLIKRTLKLVQDIEESLIDNKYLMELCKMKIILLERLCQYNLCIQYLTLIEKDINFCSAEWEKIYYIKLRCYYFRNKYDDLLDSFSQNKKYIFNQMGKELCIQILLLIGRIYYIRGNLEIALIIYLLCYQEAISANKLSLVVKSIHRIAMIEYCKGFFTESKDTFSKLTELDKEITAKRKSYAYYRIAKCCFALDQLDESIDYTKKSLSIKESYNDKRGILFSYKMLAKIYYKKHDFLKAEFYINQARNIAKELDLSKEELAVDLVFVENTLNYEIPYNEKDLLELLEKGLCIASKENLLFRINTIINLSENRWDNLSFKAKKIYQNTKQYLEEYNVSQSEFYFDQLIPKTRKLYECLHNGESAISSRLLINAGILTFELGQIKINMEEI